MCEKENIGLLGKGAVRASYMGEQERGVEKQERSRKKTGQWIFQMRDSLTLTPYCQEMCSHRQRSGQSVHWASAAQSSELWHCCFPQCDLQGRQAGFVLGLVHSEHCTWSITTTADRLVGGRLRWQGKKSHETLSTWMWTTSLVPSVHSLRWLWMRAPSNTHFQSAPYAFGEPHT